MSRISKRHAHPDRVQRADSLVVILPSGRVVLVHFEESLAQVHYLLLECTEKRTHLLEDGFAISGALLVGDMLRDEDRKLVDFFGDT